eukprot:3439165-Rhodomonas_salina.1
MEESAVARTTWPPPAPRHLPRFPHRHRHTDTQTHTHPRTHHTLPLSPPPLSHPSPLPAP